MAVDPNANDSHYQLGGAPYTHTASMVIYPHSQHGYMLVSTH